MGGSSQLSGGGLERVGVAAWWWRWREPSCGAVGCLVVARTACGPGRHGGGGGVARLFQVYEWDLEGLEIDPGAVTWCPGRVLCCSIRWE